MVAVNKQDVKGELEVLDPTVYIAPEIAELLGKNQIGALADFQRSQGETRNVPLEGMIIYDDPDVLDAEGVKQGKTVQLKVGSGTPKQDGSSSLNDSPYSSRKAVLCEGLEKILPRDGTKLAELGKVYVVEGEENLEFWTDPMKAGEVTVVSPDDMASLALRLIGQATGDYFREIRGGACSRVFTAHDKIEDSPKYLVKVINPLVSDRMLMHAKREYSVNKKVEGAYNVVPLNGFNLVAMGSETCVFIMPYVENQKYNNFVETSTSQENVSIILDMLHSLADVHDRGVVHRDVKPGNMLIAEDEGVPSAKLIDFGISTDLEEATTLRDVDGSEEDDRFVSKYVRGTPKYLPNEAVRPNTPVSPQFDVYAAGVMLYDAVTPEGVKWVPSRVLGMTDTQKNIDSLEFREDIASMSEPVQGTLAHVIERATTSDLNKRYRNAREMAEDLNNVLWSMLDAEEIVPPPVPEDAKRQREYGQMAFAFRAQNPDYERQD